MDDAIGAAKGRGEVGTLDVCGDPGRLRYGQAWSATRNTDDLVDCVVCGEGAKHACSDVAGCADHHDPSHGSSTTLKHPSSFFWNNSYALGASSSGK